MPLGTEVGLGLCDIVFDVDPAPPRKRAHQTPLNFGPCLLWPNGWMDEDAAWYGSRPRPRPHCTRRSRSSLERGTAAPLFSARLLWPWSPIWLSSCLVLPTSHRLNINTLCCVLIWMAVIYGAENVMNGTNCRNCCPVITRWQSKFYINVLRRLLLVTEL